MIINPDLLEMARTKLGQAAALEKGAFVDPATATGGGGAQDPMAGAMPPMPAMGAGDPAAAGGDPAAAAGAMPPEEGGGGGVTADEVRAIVQEAMMMQGGGGAGGGGAGGEKMKVDVNTEIYHIKKLLTRIAGELGIQIDPQMLQGDPASDPSVPMSEAAKDPDSAAASMMGGAGGGSAIGPIDPMQGASPALAGADAAQKAADDARKLNNGHPYDTGIQDTVTRAAALAAMINEAA